VTSRAKNLRAPPRSFLAAEVIYSYFKGFSLGSVFLLALGEELQLHTHSAKQTILHALLFGFAFISLAVCFVNGSLYI